MEKFFIVITTIQAPTPAIVDLMERLRDSDTELVVVGDGKGPTSFDVRSSRFLSLKSQLESPFRLARALPVGHYARKNVGYLQAIADGATCVYETDDDNAPRATWTRRSEQTQARIAERQGWVNVYRYFSDENIWPRGLPLDAIAQSAAAASPSSVHLSDVRAPIQQGLANISPDVDAVWRLALDRPFTFNDGPSVFLPRGAWCPFNSQSTWWWPDAFALMYLPSFCSFRMTDIWRSFVAQRCLWEMGHGVVFHSAEVEQDRNPHDLMRDFADEVPGYLENRRIASILEETSLLSGRDQAASNLRLCYDRLIGAGVFPEQEAALVDAWLADLETIGHE